MYNDLYLIFLDRQGLACATQKMPDSVRFSFLAVRATWLEDDIRMLFEAVDRGRSERGCGLSVCSAKILDHSFDK